MTQPEQLALDALGDPMRRRILQLLGRGPRSVREISDELPVTRPAVSHHLKVLKAAELVSAEVAGTRRIYRVQDAGLEQLRAFIEHVWGNALSRLKLVAENTGSEPEDRRQDDRGEVG